MEISGNKKTYVTYENIRKQLKGSQHILKGVLFKTFLTWEIVSQIISQHDWPRNVLFQFS